MKDLFGGDMQQLMAQLQEAQGRLQHMEQAMGQRVFDGDAGGGAVRVQVSGRMEVVSVQITPAVLDPSDPGMVEDLIRTATNRALAGAREAMSDEMSEGLFSGMMPGV